MQPNRARGAAAELLFEAWLKFTPHLYIVDTYITNYDNVIMLNFIAEQLPICIDYW